jgi:hypothetical protein
MSAERISAHATSAPSPAMPPSQAPVPIGPAREVLGLGRPHKREQRLHSAELAQITRHRELNPSGNAVHQLQAWAVRQAHEKHIHDSAMAQLRH